jgi:hypothetical protein|tara:strand:- start:352 stop:1758 length:1407 start_codon:yes stop_codon:yes gene_type:complete
MADFSKYSAFADALSDDKALYHYEKELTVNTIHKENNNQFKDKNNFLGEILVPCQECPEITPLSENMGQKVYVTKMRLDDIDANLYDHPSDVSDPQKRKLITDQHQTAYISVDPSVSTLPKPGDKVDCYYHEAGPNENGKQRGLRFKPEVVEASNSSISSYGKGGASAFSKGGYAPAGEFAGESAPEYKPDNYIKPDEAFLRRAYQSFGEEYSRPVVGDLRMVAIRFPQKQSTINKYKDVLNVFYSTDSGMVIKSYNITTIPGSNVLNADTYTKLGTGIVATGFHPELWGLDKHGTYDAGSQGRPWSYSRPSNPKHSTYYMRDNNRDGVVGETPDGTSTLYQQFGSKGFNLHRSGKTSRIGKGISGKSKPKPGRETYAVINGQLTKRNVGIWTYSAGCQVFPDPGNFAEVINVWLENKKINKIITYDYIMLSYEEYLKIKEGKLIDGVNKMKFLQQNVEKGNEVAKGN